ncbi:hypothetical protein OXYTRIMIC_681 [Oxytricha trifallax]|uniref:Uncharacterized protein n=1 Tax=Oxytricha trifallax TaxID=1172189 RepID=A0A073HZS4_9SPIT|nr:hypothetical protein OXYTRIMIC_681 [Oxytricha trifallax]
MKLLDLLNVGYKCSLDSVITHHVGTTVKLLEQKPKNPEEQFEQEEAQRREKGFFQGMNILGIFRNQQGYIGNSIIKIENI